ncbi:MAG TPA: hypothetical protein VHU19_14580 [Pyrinomonadaceae bacterium]|jgi:hypothetical protein|nr:hypothetical protein [Pyrinomonadaceae bacterium]
MSAAVGGSPPRRGGRKIQVSVAFHRSSLTGRTVRKNQLDGGPAWLLPYDPAASRAARLFPGVS